MATALTSRDRLQAAAGDAWTWRPEVETTERAAGAFERRSPNSALVERVELVFAPGAAGVTRFHSARLVITSDARVAGGLGPAHSQPLGLAAAINNLRRR